MIKNLAIAAGLVMIIAVGVLHGRWTGRWSPLRSTSDAAARLGRVPETIDGWRSTPIELDRKSVERAELDSYVARRYEDPATGMAVTVLLVCGRPGPIALHTPEVCYAGSGYEATGGIATRLLDLGTSSGPTMLREAVFSKPGAANATCLRILWTWTTSGEWRAPENPRLRFAASEILYKLYVISEIVSPADPFDGDPRLAFVKKLLPELGRSLFDDHPSS